MTFEQLTISLEALEKMSEKELEGHLSRFFNVTRPSLAHKENSQEELFKQNRVANKEYSRKQKENMVMEMAKRMGIEV